MKKVFLVFALLHFVISVVAQDKNIELPKSEGFEINYSKSEITPIFSIYVNTKKDIYLENIKLDNITQISDSINLHRSKLPPEQIPFLLILLHADKGLPYATIDSIKTALSRILIMRLCYRTNHIEDITSAVIMRNQPAMNYIGIVINEGENPTMPIFESMEMKFGRHKVQIMYDYLYDLDFSMAEELLSKFNYKLVQFIDGNTMIIDGNTYQHSEKEKINAELKDLDFYFIMSEDDLIYDDYLKNVITLFNIFKEFKTNTGNVEISFELKRALIKNNKINLLNPKK